MKDIMHALDESETSCGRGLGDAEDVSPGAKVTRARTALTNASLAPVISVSSTVRLASNAVELAYGSVGAMNVGVNRSADNGGEDVYAFHSEALAGTAPRKSIENVDSGSGGAATPKTFTSMSRARSADAARSTSALFLPTTTANDARQGARCMRRNVPGATFGLALVLRRVNAPMASFSAMESESPRLAKTSAPETPSR